MKLFLSMLLVFQMSNLIYSQISIESLEVEKGDNSFIDKFKSSKTIFVYRDSDNLEELEKVIRAIWTITEISFHPYSELKTLELDNNSVFSIDGVNTNVWNMSSNMTYDNTHVYLSLWMPIKNDKGELYRKSISRIELHPTYVDYSNITGYSSDKVLDYLYSKGNLKNWTTGLLRNYLKNVNDLLLNESEKWLYSKVIKKEEVKKLKEAKLYIPDYTLVKFNKFTGDESRKLKTEKIFKPYPYKYEIINSEKLSKKIIETKEPFYYLVYIKSSTDKYVTIYNSVTGEVIYSKYKPVSYNFKDSDLKALVKVINRASH